MNRYLLLLLTCSLLCAVSFAATPPVNYHLLKKIAVGGEGGWDYLSFDSTTQRLYLSRSTRLTVVDVKKGKVVGEIANTPGVHGAALAPKLHRGFTSNGGDNTVTVFNLKNLKVLGRVAVGKRPDAIIYDAVSNRVFTFNAGSQDATAIDASSLKVMGSVPMGGKPEFPAIDGRGLIFVNIEDQNQILAFDTRTLAVKSTWSIAPGDEPSGMAIDQINRRLFSVCHNGMMVITDADTGKIVATPAIGKGPDAANFDPGTGLAFSSNGQDGTLTIVREVSPEQFDVVANVPTQTGSRTMTLDTKYHRIYLAAAHMLPPPAETTPPATTGTPPTGAPEPEHRWHFSMEKGSFVILVLGE